MCVLRHAAVALALFAGAALVATAGCSSARKPPADFGPADDGRRGDGSVPRDGAADTGSSPDGLVTDGYLWPDLTRDTLAPDTKPQPCGNGRLDAGEQCDDGNRTDKDGCNNLCRLPGGHVVITEIAVTPTAAELIELYNPSASTVALDRYFVADRSDYYKAVQGTITGRASDFIARFPPGSTLKGGAYATVAVRATSFRATYARSPDYELIASDASVPDMIPAAGKTSIGATSGLTDSGELVVLFRWNGSADLVQDVDYVAWSSSGSTSADKVVKDTSTCIDGPDADRALSCYRRDTAKTAQMPVAPPGRNGSVHRCNYLETGETRSGGNGASGHDETSEPFATTWKRNASTAKARTPGASAPVTVCP